MSRYIWFKSLAIVMTLLAGACAKSRSNDVARPAGQNPPPIFDPNGTGPGAYAGAQLDPYAALDGMGQWVDIGDERYFVPTASQLEDDDGAAWAPYQRGYWNYDQEKSWTWVSYEPFGWLTDHYGVWRHHARHGWIWLPFADRHYEAHTVTWFDEGDYVGWYPYFADYPRAYRQGSALGFDDGYWDAYAVAATFGEPGVNFQFGFSLVTRANFSQPNLRLVLMRDMPLIYRTVSLAHGPGRLIRVGRYPGGRREDAYEFLQRYSRRRAPMGPAERIRSRGGAEIWQPHRTHPMPPEIRKRVDPRGRPEPRPENHPLPRREERPPVGPRDFGPTPGRRDSGEFVRPDTRPSAPAPEPAGPRSPARPALPPHTPTPQVTTPPAPTRTAPAPAPRETRPEERSRTEERPNRMRPQVLPPNPEVRREDAPRPEEKRREPRRQDDEPGRRRRP